MSGADPARWQSIELLITASKDFSWIIAPLAIIAIALFERFLRSKGTKREWATIHSHLDRFRSEILGEPEGPEDEHRVTLFKYKRWQPTRWRLRWWGGLLVPIERSGEHGRKTKTILRAPDKSTKAEGVGGFAWASNAAIPVVNLDPKKEEEYAAATYMSTAMVRKRKKRQQSLPLSLCGFPVRIGDSRWGVVVIDSAMPEVDYSKVESKYEEVLKTAFDNLLKGM